MQAQDDLIASFKRHEFDRGLMSRLNALEGPKRTYLRVILGDVRFLLPLVLMWLYGSIGLLGLWPALVLFAFMVAVFVGCV